MLSRRGDILKKFIGKLITALLLMSLILILGLSACASSDSAEPQEEWDARVQHDAALFAETFAVSENNPFVIASYEELITHLEYGTGVIAFGHPACPRCHNAFPVLEKAFTETNMGLCAGFRGRILYYDIFDDREANNERYQTIVGFLEEFLTHDDSGNPRIFVPDIYFIVSGKVVGNHLDTLPSVENPRDPLSEEQENELFDIYKTLIEKVEDCAC